MRRRAGPWLLVSAMLAVAAAALVLVWCGRELRAGQRMKTALREVKAWSGGVLPAESAGYIGTLSVPALELCLPVGAQCSEAELKKMPCRYAGSAGTGNLVIAGHNYAAHFGALRRLTGGETVELTDLKGERRIYRVAKTEILQPWQTEEMVKGQWELTLFTCTPGGERRLALRCREISDEDG